MLGERLILSEVLSNSQGAVVIAASVTEGVDWSAYLGGRDRLIKDSIDRQEFAEKVADYGDKVPENVARIYFPNIELPYRA